MPHLPLAVFLILMLAGCGGSSSSSSGGTPKSVTNGVVVGLTDAPGGFATYQVDVTSLTLASADGQTVQVLPRKTRVDFARDLNLTEFLSAATVPAGTYTGIAMTLDYGDADIRVEDGAGKAVPVTTVRDENGSAVSTLPVQVLTASDAPLTVAAGVTRQLTLDFDLATSNAVAMGPPVTMTVMPVIFADVDPSSPKPHRLRGALQTVDLQHGSFRADLIPFQNLLAEGSAPFGTLTIAADGATVYDIDGTAESGGAGLDSLAALLTPSSFVPVVVRADLDATSGRLTATEVRAGTSVPGYGQDAVTGTVTGRARDVLTVAGATIMKRDGGVTFNDGVTVQLGASTGVTRQLSSGGFAIGDISVGQRVTAYGNLTDGGSSPPVLDAGPGAVRLGLTALRGTVASASPGFAVALQSIDRIEAAGFDFAGTGDNPADDAEAGAYSIEGGGPTASSLDQGAAVGVLGFVTPFGEAGSGAAPADFSADSVVDLSQGPAVLAVNWNPAGAALENASSTGLILNMTAAGVFHYVSLGGDRIDLSPLLPVIQPPRSDLGAYSIRSPDGSVQGYGDFADLVTALTAKVSGGAKVARVVAQGTFDQTISTLTAGMIRVRLN